jgi:hypothetical protein
MQLEQRTAEGKKILSLKDKTHHIALKNKPQNSLIIHMQQ